jgi:hypothetical protein
MSSPPSVTLVQDNAASVAGINLKWSYVSLAAIKEVSLVYFKNVSDSDIVSKEIASGVLKYNINSEFDSGQAYSFQLQIVDINGVMCFSNTLVLTTPWFLAAPVMTGIVGKDAALQVQLQSTANVLTSADTVEFVLKRADNIVFWIIKPFASSGMYQLSSDDKALLVNNTSYRVACMYQPCDANTRYSAPSDMSASMSAVPSNTPNGVVPSTSSVGTTTLDILTTWARPSDFAEWSDSFSIVLKLQSSAQNTVGSFTAVTLNSDVTSYTWVNVPRNLTYLVWVQYVNDAGLGVDGRSINYLSVTSVPDAPLVVGAPAGDGSAVLTWYPPSFYGQSVLSGFKIYKNNVLLTTVSPQTTSYSVSDLINGVGYDFKVVAYNAIGDSVPSNVATAYPFAQMAIVSVVPVGKTLTITFNPAGNPIQSVTILAIDQDPSASELSSCMVTIPQNQISQSASGTVQVIYTFAAFSSNLAFWAVVANNSINSCQQQSSNQASA